MGSQNCGLDHTGHGERSPAWASGPVPPSPPSLLWRSSGRASALGRRGRAGSTTCGVSGDLPSPRERCCCQRYQLSACLHPGLGERRVKLLLSAAGASGQHQPCSLASFIARLGRDVLHPASFWSALGAGRVRAVSRAEEREGEVESISPGCGLACLHCCEFVGGGYTLPCLSLNFESFNRLSAHQLSFTCQIFADVHMYICICIQSQM